MSGKCFFSQSRSESPLRSPAVRCIAAVVRRALAEAQSKGDDSSLSERFRERPSIRRRSGESRTGEPSGSLARRNEGDEARIGGSGSTSGGGPASRRSSIWSSAPGAPMSSVRRTPLSRPNPRGLRGARKGGQERPWGMRGRPVGASNSSGESTPLRGAAGSCPCELRARQESGEKEKEQA